ncbi:hypothetical protein Lser_V15G18285 [Lactuca serriola]
MKKAPSNPKFTINTGVSKEVFKKKKKSKSKSQGVVIKEVTDEEEQQDKKCKAIGLLKQFKKLRAQLIEELSTKIKVVEGVKVREETYEELTEIDDLIF